MCVCTCVILLQATSCITTELAYVYELVSLYYILTILLQSETIGIDACVCFFFSESCQPFDWFPSSSTFSVLILTYNNVFSR